VPLGKRYPGSQPCDPRPLTGGNIVDASSPLAHVVRSASSSPTTTPQRVLLLHSHGPISRLQHRCTPCATTAHGAWHFCRALVPVVGKLCVSDEPHGQQHDARSTAGAAHHRQHRSEHRVAVFAYFRQSLLHCCTISPNCSLRPAVCLQTPQGFGLAALGVAARTGQKGLQHGAAFVRRRMLVDLEVTRHDEAYPWLLQWMTTYHRGQQAGAERPAHKSAQSH
jgi:hypothetical protein